MMQQIHVKVLATPTRATLNAEMPSAAEINIRPEGWDCETVRTMKRSRYIRTHGGWRLWNNQDHEAVYVVMDVMYFSSGECIYSAGERRGLLKFWLFK